MVVGGVEGKREAECRVDGTKEESVEEEGGATREAMTGIKGIRAVASKNNIIHSSVCAC